MLKDGNDPAIDKFGRFHTKISNSIMSFCDTEENFSENSTAMSPHLSDTNFSPKEIGGQTSAINFLLCSKERTDTKIDINSNKKVRGEIRHCSI